VDIRKVNVAAIMIWVPKTLAELSADVNADEFVHFLENYLKRKVRDSGLRANFDNSGI
jgi:hypothetical protein